MLCSLLLLMQGSARWEPIEDIASAKALLAKLRVRSPYVLEGYREENATPVGAHMVSLATADGTYKVWINSVGLAETAVRGYIGFSQLDIKGEEAIPPDAPEVLAACDLYVAALKGKLDFETPKVAETNKNEVTLTLSWKFDGKHVYGLNGTNVCFQPASGKLITYGGFTPAEPADSTPKVAVEDVMPTAQQAVKDHAIQGPDSRHPTDHWQLTGRRDLAYFASTNKTHLIWAVQYELFEKSKPRPPHGVYMNGGPYYSSFGNVLIDACSGQYLGIEQADIFDPSSWFKSVGHYLVARGGWSDGSGKTEPSLEMENVAKSGHSADEAIQAVDQRLKELHIGGEAKLLEIYLQKHEGSDALEWTVSEKIKGGPGVGAVVDARTNRVTSFRSM